MFMTMLACGLNRLAIASVIINCDKKVCCQIMSTQSVSASHVAKTMLLASANLVKL